MSSAGGRSAATTQGPITRNTASGFEITDEGKKVCLVACLNILLILTNSEQVHQFYMGRSGCSHPYSVAVKKQTTLTSLYIGGKTLPGLSGWGWSFCAITDQAGAGLNDAWTITKTVAHYLRQSDHSDQTA